MSLTAKVSLLLLISLEIFIPSFFLSSGFEFSFSHLLEISSLRESLLVTTRSDEVHFARGFTKSKFSAKF